MFLEDLDLFIDADEFAVPVVANGVSGSGIFDAPGEYVGESGIALSTEYQLRCKAAQFGGLEYGDPVVVGGQAYVVRDNRPLFDGAFCLLMLSKDETVAVNSFLITSSGNYLVTQDGRRLLISAA